MEKRPYFVLGDIFSNVFVGALVGLAASAMVGEGWNMVVGMAGGMGVGMVLALLSLLVFCPLFGALEVMLPVMLSGMASGMGVGMLASGRALCGSSATGLGALMGGVVILGTYILQARLQSKAGVWTL